MSIAGISAQGRHELAQVVTGGRRTVTPSDVSEALDVDAATAAKKLARWASQGWLRRARRGLYIPVPVDVAHPSTWTEDPWILADAVWSPCYITGWSAANHWDLTEQVFRSTVVRSAKRVRNAHERLLDNDFVLGHASLDSMSWGLRTVWRQEVRLQLADPARTVVEAFDDPSSIGGIRHGAEVLNAYLDAHDWARLVEYADRIGNRTIFKRMGYITESLRREGHQELIAACMGRVSSGISTLDPTGPEGGSRQPRWGLRINVAVTPVEYS